MPLKLIANLLVWGSLVLGTVSVSTAYLPPIEDVRAVAERAAEDASASAAPDADDSAGAAPLTLVSPAGDLKAEVDGERTGDATGEPVLAPSARLDLAALEALANDSAVPVERVRVKEFSFGRWPELIWFLLAAAGLVGGAMLMRLETKRAAQADAASHASRGTLSPAAALAAADEVLSNLLRTRGQGTEAERRQQIVDQLDVVRQQHFEPFIMARPQLIDRLGMSGFAQLMDAFAGADRKLNRAWSAAADGYAAEAEECLDHGLARLREACERLDG